MKEVARAVRGNINFIIYCMVLKLYYVYHGNERPAAMKNSSERRRERMRNRIYKYSACQSCIENREYAAITLNAKIPSSDNSCNE